MNAPKSFNHRITPAAWVLGIVLFGIAPAWGQSTSRADRARNDAVTGFKENPRMLAAFSQVVAAPSRSVVRVRCDNKDVALGTIVDADGWIITKNSELTSGRLTVVLKDGRILTAKVTGADDRYDLAMLKVDAKGLTPVVWGQSQSAQVGELLASPGTGREPVAVGVLSVAARAVRARDLMVPPPPANAGFLGVSLDEGNGGARVITVTPNSAAAKAGLRVDDVVVLVADIAIIDSETMVNTIRHHKPGDALPIKIKRDGQEIELNATLGKRPADPGLARREYQNHLGSALSERRSGFPQVLQHDMVLLPDNCGGPVVDLDGKTIGINIARAGRVESYAIPAEAVRNLIDSLKTGKSSMATSAVSRASTPATQPTRAPNPTEMPSKK